MFETTHFVQKFSKRGRSLVAGTPERCNSEMQARNRARRAADHVDGVIAYAVSGDAEFGDTEPPVILERHGETPGDLT